MSPLCPSASAKPTSRLVQRVPARAVHLHLLGQREGHAVRRRAELRDLLGRAGLLPEELVAGHAQHGEAPLGVPLLELLQPGVLRGQTALGGHVHDEHGLARVLRQVRGAAGERPDLDIQHVVVSSRHARMLAPPGRRRPPRPASTSTSPAAVRTYSTDRPARRRSTRPASRSTFRCRPTDPQALPGHGGQLAGAQGEPRSSSTPARAAPSSAPSPAGTARRPSPASTPAQG